MNIKPNPLRVEKFLTLKPIFFYHFLRVGSKNKMPVKLCLSYIASKILFKKNALILK